MIFSILNLVFEETTLGLLMDRAIVEAENPVFLATSCIVVFFFIYFAKSIGCITIG